MKNSKNIIIAALALIGVIAIISAIFIVKKTERLTDKNSVKVYFVRKNNKSESVIVPVRRKLPHDSSEVKLLIAVQELLKGPSEKEKKQGFYTEIPSATKLIGIEKTDDEKIIINFSEDFESGGGSNSMTIRLKQFSNTALDAEKDKPVYLELNGKKVDFIGGEGVAVSQPILR